MQDILRAPPRRLATIGADIPSADARALDRIGLEWALRRRILPLEPSGAVRPVALACTTPPSEVRAVLEKELGAVAFIAADGEAIESEIRRLRERYLANRATMRTPPRFSCREWSGQRTSELALFAIAVACLLAALWPSAALLILAFWAVLTLALVTGLRTLGAVVQIRAMSRSNRTWKSLRAPEKAAGGPPTVSLLIPLFRETEVVQNLVARLERLDYPRDRLEALLVLEADDDITLTALGTVDLPPWVSIVRVPPGTPRTKPRALNFAFDFANGDIVGIYDAEDRPAPDQLRKVAAAFARAKPDVACLQGVLDFYNARDSWLTRCFTLDYAAWFRLVLPGLARLGYVVPLGGTTVFFRRDALDDLGRWDAHNVTEDADIGVRLARRGYRTDFIASVTEEEATRSLGAWLRQRSRWIKGYAITWAVHMRHPLRLLRDLGLRRFLGIQILFLGTLSQFALAPLLLSFWLIPFGVAHPLTALVPESIVIATAILFFACEIATMAVAALAVSGARHRKLIWWVPVLHLYFPLAALAWWKAFAELLTVPFYWDKTAHGRASAPPQDSAARA